MSDRLEEKRWGFGECRHALYEGDRTVFDSMRDMGLSAEDAARIEERLNAYDRLIAEVERLEGVEAEVDAVAREWPNQPGPQRLREFALQLRHARELLATKDSALDALRTELRGEYDDHTKTKAEVERLRHHLGEKVPDNGGCVWEEKYERLRGVMLKVAKEADRARPTDMGVSMTLGYIVEDIGLALGWECDETSVIRPWERANHITVTRPQQTGSASDDEKAEK